MQLNDAAAGVQNDPKRLTAFEIKTLVQRYIGVHDGYLGDFSYASHRDFYVALGLDIDPKDFEGTTRAKFISILQKAPAHQQAIILEGILHRYPVGSAETRTKELHEQLSSWLVRLHTLGAVPTVTLKSTSTVVERALVDAEALLKSSGASSGIDRIHTALHGHLLHLAKSFDSSLTDQASLNELLKVIREKHPAFQVKGPRAQDIESVLRSMSAIAAALNPIRNKASLAHPSERLLDEPEAMLVINASRTLLHYIEAKLCANKNNSEQTTVKT